jgi:hypothetical protein
MITLKTSNKALDCIASYGFLSKKDCKGYLESTTLSPLNERNVTALFLTKDTAIVESGYNYIKIIPESTSVNASTITARYKAIARNEMTETLSIAHITIKANRHYKDRKPVGTKYFPCEKHCGHIKENESGKLVFFDFSVTVTD